MIEDRSHDRDDLNDRLQLAQLAGLNGEALRSSDGAQAAHQELAPDDQHGDPGRNDSWVIGHQHDVGGGYHELVGQGVEQDAQCGDLATLSRQVAVKAVRDRGQDEQDTEVKISCSP